tara:strand:+ start:1388 stop:1543 length:156 start_codon:yes stop_codon:yes gene_type:complete
MAIVTIESQKLRDKLTYLERKLDYASGFDYDYLMDKIDNLINKINRIEGES